MEIFENEMSKGREIERKRRKQREEVRGKQNRLVEMTRKLEEVNEMKENELE